MVHVIEEKDAFLEGEERRHVSSLAHGILPVNVERLRGTRVSECCNREGGRVALTRLMENA